MTSTYRAVAGRIRHEIAALERTALRAVAALAEFGASGDDRFVDASALNLHAYYSGIERLFELVAREIDGSVPGGPNWHTDLLAQMAAAIAEVRPGVITSELHSQLDPCRGFRHVVRNAYTYNLDPALLGVLASDLMDVHAKVALELTAFSSFLDGITAPTD